MSDERNAYPDRYSVTKLGTQDPGTTQYFVMDLVHDFEARVSVAKMLSNYERQGKTSQAEECRRALRETFEAHQAAMEARNPKAKSRRSVSR